MLSPKMLSGSGFTGIRCRPCDIIILSCDDVQRRDDARVTLSPHPEERGTRVSKDEGRAASAGPSWFETALTRLLTMRSDGQAALATSTLRKRTSEKWPSGGIRRRSASSMPLAPESHFA